MMEDPRKRIVAGVFGLFFLWFSYANITGSASQRELFSDTYWVLPLIGAIFGLGVSRKWGGFKSTFGKSISFFSLGLFAQCFGQIVSSVYARVLQVEIPYPSLGDVGYLGGTVLYIIGTYYLAKTIGVKFSLKKFSNKILAFVLPLILLSISYYIFLSGHEYDFSQPLTVFLDFGYPLGHAMYLSLALLALLLSRKVLGGVMQSKVLWVLGALFMQYIADFTFLYRYSRELYVAGSITDGLYLVSYLIMSLALLNLATAYRQIQEGKHQQHKNNGKSSNIEA
jgi:hypothetical protein